MKKILALFFLSLLLVPSISKAEDMACLYDANGVAKCEVLEATLTKEQMQDKCADLCNKYGCKLPDSNKIITGDECQARGYYKAKPTYLANPLSMSITNIPQLIGQLIEGALGLVGVLVLLAFFYGGMLWFTAAGNEENISKGVESMKWAVIGLVVIFSSYGILRLVLETLGK